MRIPKFWGLNANPGFKFNFILALMPFLILITAYLWFSDARLDANPKDKIMPSISKMIDTTYEYAFVPKRNEYRLLNDTTASLSRIIAGVGLSAIVGLMLGMNMALFSGMRSLFSSIITFLSIIPPLALMPVFLITLGTGEVAKIGLIFVGTLFMITRDVFRATNEIPKEQITKVLTLGATQLEVVYKIVLPQIFPSLLDTVRLSLGAAWLFLIAGEAIASTDGLGYTIYLVKRYLAMDVIIPYVLIITGLGFTMDWMIRKFIQWRYPWYVVIKGGQNK